MFSNNSVEDSQLIAYVGSLCSNPANPDKKARVFDCRPFLNAVGNKVTGKGYLETQYYNIHEVKFGDIENIHFMRNAFKDLTDGLEDYS